MAERSRDWFRQAESDLRHARHALDDGDYDWAAFASHQAAEKAIKAVFQKRHADAWGHTLSVLLGGLPAASRAEAPLLERAKELDKHYIPTLSERLRAGCASRLLHGGRGATGDRPRGGHP